MLHKQAHCRDEGANHPLPIAAAFWIIWITSTDEYFSLMQNLIQIDCFTCAVILNVTVQVKPHSAHAHSRVVDALTSTVKLSLFMNAHSSPISLAVSLNWGHTNHSHYITNGWTFLGQNLYIVCPSIQTYNYFLRSCLLNQRREKKELQTKVYLYRVGTKMAA